MRLSRLQRTARRGFTIIEVVVATLVLSLILVSLYGTWQIILRSTDRALQVTVNAQRARMAVRVVEEAVGAAQMFQANAGMYAFFADSSGQFSSLSFCANLPESFPGGGYFGAERLRRVNLIVESGDSGPELRLYQNSAHAPPDADVAAVPIVLARDVSAFQLEFMDPRTLEYAPEWRWTNQLPRMVRVSMGFGGGGSRPPEVVTRSVLVSSTTVPPGAAGGGLIQPPAR